MKIKRIWYRNIARKLHQICTETGILQELQKISMEIAPCRLSQLLKDFPVERTKRCSIASSNIGQTSRGGERRPVGYSLTRHAHKKQSFPFLLSLSLSLSLYPFYILCSSSSSPLISLPSLTVSSSILFFSFFLFHLSSSYSSPSSSSLLSLPPSLSLSLSLSLQSHGLIQQA